MNPAENRREVHGRYLDGGTAEHRTRGKDEPDAEQGAMDELGTGQREDRYEIAGK